MAYTFKFVRGKKTILLFPVPPESMNINIKNQNNTISLINGEEINVLSSPGLREIEFEAMLPRVRYPFANYEKDPKPDKSNTKFLSGNKRAKHFLSELSKLKKSKKPFQFIITRTSPTGEKTNLGDTNIKVSLEDYVIKEDVQYGFDVMVAIRLKEYKSYGTKTYKKNKKIKPKGKSRDYKDIPKTYKVVKGDTLSKIAKKTFGDSSRYKEIAKLNKISNPNSLKVGKVIKLP